MMRTLCTKILFQKRFFTVGWSIGLIALIMLTVLFFPSLKTGGIAESFDQMPAAFQSLLGDIASFQTISGYVGQQVYAFRAPMLLLVLSVLLFAGLTAGDEQKKLTETQLSLPIRRSKLLAHKLAAGVLIVITANVAVLVGVVAGVSLIHENYVFGTAVQLTAACTLVVLGYSLIAFLLGAWTGRRGLALGVTAAVTFLSYLINSMATSVDGLEVADKFTLFHYYHANAMADTNWLVLIVVPVLMVVLSFVGFRKRDLSG
jgi:ABC-2 type transport system permease protein